MDSTRGHKFRLLDGPDIPSGPRLAHPLSYPQCISIPLKRLVKRDLSEYEPDSATALLKTPRLLGEDPGSTPGPPFLPHMCQCCSCVSIFTRAVPSTGRTLPHMCTWPALLMGRFLLKNLGLHQRPRPFQSCHPVLLSPMHTCVVLPPGAPQCPPALAVPDVCRINEPRHQQGRQPNCPAPVGVALL